MPDEVRSVGFLIAKTDMTLALAPNLGDIEQVREQASGIPKLREHLGAVIAMMKLSNDWHDFKTKLDKNYPRQGKPTKLSFDYENEEAEDTGRGL